MCPRISVIDHGGESVWSRPFTTTPAPHTAKASETALPIPRLPPTTTAARPAR